MTDDVDPLVTREKREGPQQATDQGFDPAARLADREQRGLRRDLQPVDRVAARARVTPDPKGSIPEDGEQQLLFAANDYLGLASDERVAQAAAEEAQATGTGSGASRLVTGDTKAHRALERDIANVKKTERALVFSSGFATNVGVLTALEPDVVFSDELNHASIVDGCRLSGAETIVYDHADAGALAKAMERRADRETNEESWLVVTDSVFSMDGDIAPLEGICEEAERHGAWVMVDEAHATGLYENGQGIVGHEGLTDRVHVQMGTLSKALASQGGYVAGSEALIEHLLNAARSFVFSTGLAPPAVGAARESLRITRESEASRAQLWRSVERLREGLIRSGFEVWGETQILPVVVGDRADAETLSDRLREYGIVAPAIRPPTVPEGTSRLRVVPMATHTEEEIQHCLDGFEAAGRTTGIL